MVFIYTPLINVECDSGHSAYELRTTYKRSNTSLGLNWWSHRSFEVVLRCLEPASMQTSKSDSFCIPVFVSHEQNVSLTLWWYCTLLEWCKHNP